MFHVYILYSQKFNRTYTGQTQNLGTRLDEHNSGYNNSTKHYIPWDIIYSEVFDTRDEAILCEKFLNHLLVEDLSKIPFLTVNRASVS